MSDSLQTSLRHNVNMLGTLLGDTIRDHKGQAFFDKIEAIRQLSKKARNSPAGQEYCRQELLELLHGLPDDELVPVARAFSHFLNLSNVAEQFSSVSKEEQAAPNASEPFPELLKILKSRGLSSQQIADSLSGLSLEVVLTAHPTEVSRRTHILKYEQVFQCLESLEDKGLTVMKKKRWKIAFAN